MTKDIWAPWRIDYILGPKSGECAFCLPLMESGPERDEDDRRRLVVWRGRRLFVMLNRYPYAAWHLMVIPYRHVPDITELDAEESAEMMELVQLSIHRLPEPMRELVHLRLTGEFSFAEIGSLLGKSENWARTAFYRAKQKIRKELNKNE